VKLRRVEISSGIARRAGERLHVRVGEGAAARDLAAAWARTFGEVPEGALLLTADSYGRASLAVHRGSAAAAYGLTLDALIEVARLADASHRLVPMVAAIAISVTGGAAGLNGDDAGRGLAGAEVAQVGALARVGDSSGRRAGSGRRAQVQRGVGAGDAIGGGL
jgi:hypothetical protein